MPFEAPVTIATLSVSLLMGPTSSRGLGMRRRGEGFRVDCPAEVSPMPDKPYQVYVIHGRGAQRDYADTQAVVAHVPAKVTTLPFIPDENGMIAALRDADALIIAASPVTRAVMSACEGL